MASSPCRVPGVCELALHVLFMTATNEDWGKGLDGASATLSVLLSFSLEKEKNKENKNESENVNNLTPRL